MSTQETTTDTFVAAYERLNEAQRQAVDAIEGTVMVLAGPGTGKTQVLALRIANILQRTQMDPYNILCLTFTESAVVAMRKRLISIMGSTAYGVRIHTFHSFCNEVIRENPDYFSQFGEGQVLADVERVQLFQEIIDALPATNPLKPFGNPYLFLPALQRAVASLKQEHISIERYEALIAQLQAVTDELQPVVEPFLQLRAAGRTPEVCADVVERITEVLGTDPQREGLQAAVTDLWAACEEGQAAADGKRAAGVARTHFKNQLARWYRSLKNPLARQEALGKVYEQYQQLLRERGLYDFEDMITQVVEAFATHDSLLAQYQEQFQYVLVDEYQDTNGAQNELLYRLTSFEENPNLFVVGDDRQSIYRFQGASMENLLSFVDRFVDRVQVIVLRDNYRSHQVILDAATAVIAHNKETVAAHVAEYEHDLQAVLETEEAPVATFELADADAERYFVAERIKSLLAEGVPPEEIAVLYRTNAEADALYALLQALEVPAEVQREENIFDTIAIRQLLDLLHYLAQPEAEERLWRLLQYPWLGLLPVATLQVARYARAERVPLLTVLQSAEHLQAAGVEEVEPFVALVARLARWRVEAESRTMYDWLAYLLDDSGFTDYFWEIEDTQAVAHVQVLFAEVRQLAQRQHQLSLAGLLEYLQLFEEHTISLIAKRQRKQAAVQLMTAHKAKGLEFAHVFVLHVADRHWSNGRSRNLLPLPSGILRYDRTLADREVEEERRLFYVAMTRAKKRLYITYPRQSVSGRELTPALFVHELPSVCVTHTVAEELSLPDQSTLTKAVLTPRRQSSSVRDFVAGLVSDYVVNVTHLNHYMQCPRLFYYRNLLRFPLAKNKHMAFGTAVHAAMRDLLVKPEAPLPQVAYLQQRFAAHLAKEILTEQDQRDCLALGSEILPAYYARYQAEWVRDVELEYSFATHGVTINDIPVTGIIDKVEVVEPEQKLVNVVDYKTGNPDGKSSAVRPGGDYWRQIVFYKLLGEGSDRFPYTITSGEIDFVQPSGTTGKFVKKKVTVQEKDLAQVREEIQQLWESVQSLAFLDDGGCGECEFCKLEL